MILLKNYYALALISHSLQNFRKFLVRGHNSFLLYARLISQVIGGTIFNSTVLSVFMALAGFPVIRATHKS